MVVFSCNKCGESVHKKKVVGHQLKCKQCTSLSCVDCGKEFSTEKYSTHQSCVTEDEKYGGKNYQPKDNAGKGEKKQAAWLEALGKQMETASYSANVKAILEKLVASKNAPKSLAKLKNFMNSSLHCKDDSLVSQVWEICAKAKEICQKDKNVSDSAPQGKRKCEDTTNDSGEQAKKQKIQQKPKQNEEKKGEKKNVADEGRHVSQSAKRRNRRKRQPGDKENVVKDNSPIKKQKVIKQKVMKTKTNGHAVGPNKPGNSPGKAKNGVQKQGNKNCNKNVSKKAKGN